MAVQQGKGQIFGLAGGTIVFTNPAGAAITGYITPDLQTLRVAHGSKVDEIKGQDGEYNAFIVSGERFECEFTYIPQGSTVANAKLSAQLPPIGSSGVISGLPVIIMGSIADVFNTGVWYYQGGGSTNQQNDQHWTGSFTLVRYPGIATTTALS